MSTLSKLSIICLMMEGHHGLLAPSRRWHGQHSVVRHFGPSCRNNIGSLSSSLLDSSSDQPRRVKIRARTASKERSATLTRPKRKSKQAAKPEASTAESPRAVNENIKSKDVEEEEEPVYYSRKPTQHTKSGAPFQHQEMMDHTLMTKEEEVMYGRRVVRARELRERIDALLEERGVESEMRRLEMEEMALLEDEDGEGEEETLDYDFLSYELEYLSVYGYRPSKESTADFDLEDDLLIDHAQHRSQHISQLESDPSAPNFVPTNNKKGPKRNGYRNGSSSLQTGASSAARTSYTPLLSIPIHRLTESDVIQILEVPGGKSELVDILLEGAYARETLMRRNVKLVMSIAKNWARNSFSTANANGSVGDGRGGSGSLVSGKNGNKSGDKGTRKYLAQMYEGSWDRPSLDEAVQEGMLGLARATDKYDPNLGLRFSTYATHWITSYVRVCFQRAVTGCLRVPSQLHDIKAAYNRILKDHIQGGGDPPGKERIAAQLGISERRLRMAIRATGSLLSVDAPVISGGGGSYKGSNAGGDGSNSQQLLILDTLKCDQPKPEDQVEISFLRQCLENAMATELTPYERDVLRLRLGLDSGEGKTVREIVEISGGSVSMSDVRSAERRAFKKLRSPASVHTHNLLAYLDVAGVDEGTMFRR